MTENETWRPVPGFDGFLASPDQQVKRMAFTANGHRRKERILVPSFYHDRPASRAKSNGAYLRLTRDGEMRHVALAEIMAATFVRDDFDPAKHQIIFNDQNPRNCAPSNLTIIQRH